jgi:thiamine kinase-like enzyme
MLSHTGNMPPQDVLARLRKHAADTTGNVEVLAAGARPLAGGRNNAVYEWASPDGPVCVKIYRVDDRRRLEREWLSLTILARHQMPSAPAPLWIDPDPDQPAIGMTLLPGRPLPDIEDRREPLQALAAVLRQLAALPLAAELGSMARIDSASHYIRRITGIWAPALAGSPRDALTRDLQRILSQWAESGDAGILAEPAPRIFSRGDSNLLNWLWDGTRIRCVDFEFAGWSDLPFDCADLIEHISAREIDDQTWAETVSSAGLREGDHRRFAAAQRTCALRWLAVLWKQREKRTEEFTVQLDRVRRLHSSADATA